MNIITEKQRKASGHFWFFFVLHRRRYKMLHTANRKQNSVRTFPNNFYKRFSE